MANHESGLFGVSQVSADMRDLLAQESADARAGEAMALFCYQAPAATPNSSTRGQGKLPHRCSGVFG